MTAPDTPAAPRRTLRWVLLASLILNGLLGGYLIGRFAGPHGWSPFHHSRMMRDASPVALSGLPASLRDAMRGELREKHLDMRERFEGLRGTRRAIRDAIAAEPFDAGRLETAFAELREAQAVLQRELQGIAVEVVARMTPEERKRLSEWRGPDGMMREGREPRQR